MKIVNVNAHLHTPYSFSAFESLNQALELALEQEVRVVGINDFYSMDGYELWEQECRKRSLCPLFNIEFIGLNQQDQARGIRVNDPNNPGRTYISGKGLKCPPSLPEPFASELSRVRAESNAQVKAMCAKLNELLDSLQSGIRLDYGQILGEMTQGNIRERHLAKALRIKVCEAAKAGADEAEANVTAELPGDAGGEVATKIAALFQQIFGGKALKSDINDHAAVENEIRGNLLKAGGAAFVPEDPRAFLPVDKVCNIILAAGGIPTYPFLADDPRGGYTDFEGDLEQVAKSLRDRGFYSVEFISTRNDLHLLEKYAVYLYELGFIVTLGSEHNSPAMEPILLSARHGQPLSERLREINYKSACVLAAHQHLVRQGLEGYLDGDGRAHVDKREEYIKLGNQLIRSITGQ